MGGVLNVVFVLAAANILGTEQFGLFALSITVMQIALQFAGQGIDTVLVRFYISQVSQNSQREGTVLRACLYVRILLTALTVATGVVLSEVYVNYAYRPDLRMPLILSFVGCCIASFWYYLLAVFQATEHYARHSLLTFSVNALKIILLVILFVMQQCSVFSLLSAQIAAFALGVCVAALLSPRSFLGEATDARRIGTQVFGFGKWVIFSSLVSILYNRIDILILSSSRTILETGYYSAAVSLISGFDLITISLFTVCLPNASKIRNYIDTTQYIKFSSTISLGVTIILCLVYVFSDALILAVLGESYVESIDVFRIVFPGLLWYIFTFPWALVIYSYNKPHLLFFSDVIVLSFNVIAGLICIPRFGLAGASWVNLTTRLLNSAILIFLVVRESRRLKRSGESIPLVG